MRSIDEITTDLMATFCDTLCKYPCTIEDQDELDERCAECPVEDFIAELLNYKGGTT